MTKSKGTISIFLIIITLASVCFGGLFIDAARILAAERRVTNALNAAARSSMAYYDESLAAEYGLYGLSRAKAESNFNRYFNANLTLAKNDYLELLKFEVEKTSIKVEKPLVSKESQEFKKQILEYMKYKGPLITTEGALEKFAGAFSPQRLNVVEKSSGITSSFETFRDSVNKLRREKLRDHAANFGPVLLQEAKNKILSENVSAISGYNGLMKDIDAKLKDAEAAIITTEDQIRIYEHECKTMQQASEQARAVDGIQIEYRYEADSSLVRVLAELSKVQGQLAKAKVKLSAIKGQLQPKVQQYSLVRDQRIKKSMAAKEDVTPTDEELKQLDQLQKEEANLKADITLVLEELSQIKVENITEVKVDLSNPGGNKDKSEAKKKLDNNKSVLENKIKEALKNMGPYKISPASRSADNPNITYQEFDNENNVQNGSESVFNYFTDIASAVEKAAVAGANEIYLTEYIMDKCTYLTSQTDRNRYFKKGEVEYILCGNDSEWLNITETLAIISNIRLAINTVDFFITNPIPEPLTRLAFALTKGAAQTLKDMFDMIFVVDGQKPEIDISPSLAKLNAAPKVTYSDHLRLALLLKMDGGINGLQNTMQATLKTIKPRSTDLTTLNAGVQAAARVKVNLLFLPLIGLEKLNFPGFEDGQYIVTKEVSLGY